MTKATLHQLYRFRERFRQHPPWKSLAYTQGIWNPTRDRPGHHEFLQQLKMQSTEQQHQLQCEDRRKAGLLYVVVALQPDNCLGDASNNSRPTTRHQVDPLLNITRPRLCWRPGFALTHTPAYARENIPAMDLCTASRSDSQSEEDQVDDAVRLQPSSSQSERRRSSNKWRVHLPRKHSQTRRRSRQRHQESPQ